MQKLFLDMDGECCLPMRLLALNECHKKSDQKVQSLIFWEWHPWEIGSAYICNASNEVSRERVLDLEKTEHRATQAAFAFHRMDCQRQAGQLRTARRRVWSWKCKSEWLFQGALRHKEWFCWNDFIWNIYIYALLELFWCVGSNITLVGNFDSIYSPECSLYQEWFQLIHVESGWNKYSSSWVSLDGGIWGTSHGASPFSRRIHTIIFLMDKIWWTSWCIQFPTNYGASNIPSGAGFWCCKPMLPRLGFVSESKLPCGGSVAMHGNRYTRQLVGENCQWEK